MTTFDRWGMTAWEDGEVRDVPGSALPSADTAPRRSTVATTGPVISYPVTGPKGWAGPGAAFTSSLEAKACWTAQSMARASGATRPSTSGCCRSPPATSKYCPPAPAAMARNAGRSSAAGASAIT
jgi:hypothetical protein